MKIPNPIPYLIVLVYCTTIKILTARGLITSWKINMVDKDREIIDKPINESDMISPLHDRLIT